MRKISVEFVSLKNSRKIKHLKNIPKMGHEKV